MTNPMPDGMLLPHERNQRSPATSYGWLSPRDTARAARSAPGQPQRRVRSTVSDSAPPRDEAPAAAPGLEAHAESRRAWRRGRYSDIVPPSRDTTPTTTPGLDAQAESRRAWRRGRRFPKGRVSAGAASMGDTGTPGTTPTGSWGAITDAMRRESAPGDFPPPEKDASASGSFDMYLPPSNSGSFDMELPSAELLPPASEGNTGAPTEVDEVRAELAQCMREMRLLQERYYKALHASVQENFEATGALEARLDALVTTGGVPNRRSAVAEESPSRVLMWTVVDGVSMVLLWLISILIARPYQLLRRVLPESRPLDRVVARRSWRLSAGKEPATEADFSFAGKPRRLSFGQQ